MKRTSRFDVELELAVREEITAPKLEALISRCWGLSSKAKPGRAHAELEDVHEFQTKFGIPMKRTPEFLDEDAYKFRVNFMREELQEFLDACAAQNLPEAADALGDLVYVAMGLALMMGLPWADIWDEIHKANLTKVRVTGADQSKRGSMLDVVKPEGFKHPDHTPALLRAFSKEQE